MVSTHSIFNEREHLPAWLFAQQNACVELSITTNFRYATIQVGLYNLKEFRSCALFRGKGALNWVF